MATLLIEHDPCYPFPDLVHSLHKVGKAAVLCHNYLSVSCLCSFPHHFCSPDQDGQVAALCHYCLHTNYPHFGCLLSLPSIVRHLRLGHLHPPLRLLASPSSSPPLSLLVLLPPPPRLLTPSSSPPGSSSSPPDILLLASLHSPRRPLAPPSSSPCYLLVVPWPPPLRLLASPSSSS